MRVKETREILYSDEGSETLTQVSRSVPTSSSHTIFQRALQYYKIITSKVIQVHNYKHVNYVRIWGEGEIHLGKKNLG